jgi:hypothetical protein
MESHEEFTNVVKCLKPKKQTYLVKLDPICPARYFYLVKLDPIWPACHFSLVKFDPIWPACYFYHIQKQHSKLFKYRN